MFNHPDDLVRYEAVRAAGELEAEGAREAIFDLLEEGTDNEDLYYAAIWSLTKIGGRGVRKLIEMDLSESEDPDEISFLEEALENLDFNEQIHRFDMMLLDKDIPEDWDSDDLSNYLENYDEFDD
jgi:HEAT repeat protein